MAVVVSVNTHSRGGYTEAVCIYTCTPVGGGGRVGGGEG